MTRSFLVRMFLVVLSTAHFLTGNANAQEYPTRPISFVIPLEAGSAGDILARPLLQNVSEILGKPINVINKPGGGTTIGSLEIHNAKPDGYTIGLGVASMLTSNLAGLSKLTYRNFTHIGTFYEQSANVFASSKTKRPFKSIQDLIAFAKKNPGEVSLSASAVGQANWVGAMAFLAGAGIDVNVIPQAGAAGLTITQIAGGHADLAVADLAAAKGQLEAGNIRFLAVVGDKRAPGYPDVPTLKESGYDVVWASAGFVIGPPNLPKNVTDRLVKAFETASNNPAYQKFLNDRFALPMYLPPAKVLSYLEAQNKIIRDTMQKAGILKTQ